MTLEPSTIQAMQDTTVARKKLIELAKAAIKSKLKAKQKTDKKLETQP